jgi:hypothetical protein
MQKNYIERKKAIADKEEISKNTKPANQPAFKSNPYHNYNSSFGMRI